MKVKFIMVIASVSLMACGHAWVIDQKPDGGVIGYEGYSNSSSEEVPGAVKKMIPCPDFNLVSNNVKTQPYQFASTQTPDDKNNPQLYTSAIHYPQIDNHGFESRQLPEQQSSEKSWRELTYTCSSVGRVPSSSGNLQCEGNCVGDGDQPDFSQRHFWMFSARGGATR